jgi:ParB-like chromosome segregation protein Spo0J
MLGQQIVLRAPGSLRINPRNAHTHSKRQIRQLANSIEAAGFIGAIVIDETDMVLAGQSRRAPQPSIVTLRAICCIQRSSG